MLKQRVITAIILAVLFLAALFLLPEMAWGVLVLLIVGQGAVEWTRLAGMTGRTAYAYALLVLSLMLALMLLNGRLDVDSIHLIHLAVFAWAVFFWVIGVTTWLIVSWKPTSKLLMGIVGLTLLIPTGLAMIDLRLVSPWLLLGLMALVWLADISAYFAGRRFGKNKLAPQISPGKTWEGVFGALIMVSLAVVIVGWTSGIFHRYPIFPGIVVASWWWVGLSVIGDLFESAIKRQAGVKDSGALLPGHGGLLDRIDALTSTLPLAGLALILQLIAP
jgi:phosphatidate cytidylyltransferase